MSGSWAPGTARCTLRRSRWNFRWRNPTGRARGELQTHSSPQDGEDLCQDGRLHQDGEDSLILAGITQIPGGEDPLISSQHGHHQQPGGQLQPGVCSGGAGQGDMQQRRVDGALTGGSQAIHQQPGGGGNIRRFQPGVNSGGVGP